MSYLQTDLTLMSACWASEVVFVFKITTSCAITFRLEVLLALVWWNKLKYTYFVLFWLALGDDWHQDCVGWLQQWNYCCAIALDGLACAEFTGIRRTQGRIEFNLASGRNPMQIGALASISSLQLNLHSPERMSESQIMHHLLFTMFYLWVVVYFLIYSWGLKLDGWF